MLAALKGLGVAKVTVEYDGSGDSGQINDMAVECLNPLDIMTAGELKEVTVVVNTISSEWDDATKKHERKVMDAETTVRSAVEDLLYDWLQLNHCGWENNDGAYGTLELDVATGVASYDHNERVIHIESHQEEL